jgi:hypothetical protein
MRILLISAVPQPYVRRALGIPGRDQFTEYRN